MFLTGKIGGHFQLFLLFLLLFVEVMLLLLLLLQWIGVLLQMALVLQKVAVAVVIGDDRFDGCDC